MLYRCNGCEALVTVTKVTPTGRIRIDSNDRLYNKYGREMGVSSVYSSYLYEPKDEDFERIKIAETKKKASRILRTLANNMDYETALKIIEKFEVR